MRKLNINRLTPFLGRKFFLSITPKHQMQENLEKNIAKIKTIELGIIFPLVILNHNLLNFSLYFLKFLNLSSLINI